MTAYPDNVDVFQRPLGGTHRSDSPTELETIDTVMTAIERIQRVLGVLPGGAFETVVERLDAAALTYPTFTFDSYSAGNVDANVATTDYYTANQIRPYILLDDTNLNPVNLPEYSAEATLPDGWTISPYTSLGYTGSRIIVPDGVYAVSWYWDCSYGDSTTWDNWIRMESIANDGTQYPTAPQSYVGGPWGAAAAVVKLVGPTNRISFQCTNRSGTDTGILLHTITITRLDA